MIRLFDTLSGKFESFVPQESGKVKLYVCGPTVYDHAHIGHGRVYVIYDTIVRYLRFRKFSVTYVRNITDIDDKIIQRAASETVSFQELAAKYTASFHADMEALGLTPPDYEPRASETMEEICQMIQLLLDEKVAYQSGGDVYFSINQLKEYGKLSKKDLEDLKAGARVAPGEQKKDPLDFALWKGAKPGEPSWDAPWGKGRPGWHIECSAMAKKYLGDSIDIHAGGRDLIFPHHENEIAQSEAANKKPFAKYWLHNGFVNINKEKMSKSLGNIVNLKTLLEAFHPEALKLYILSSHYRSPMDFSDTQVKEAAYGLDRMYRMLLAIPAEGKNEAPPPEYRERFETAMNDDFNTAQAVGVIFDAVKEANRLQLKSDTMPKAVALRGEIIGLANVLGLLMDDPATYFQRLPGEAGAVRAKIETLIAERAEVRREKNFKRADEIRDQLRAMDIILEDGPEGTTWRRQ